MTADDVRARALEYKVRTTDILWARGWWEEKSRYLFVWVGFLYTVLSLDPSGLPEIRTSRKASCPSDSVSRVNWILGSMELRLQWKFTTESGRNTCHLHTSSRNEVGRGKKLGLYTQHPPLQGQLPLQRQGNPWLCHGPAGRGSYGRREKWHSGKIRARWWFHPLLVCLVRKVLSRRCCQSTWMTRPVGTLVKRKTSSKEIRVLSSLRVCEDMNVAKSVELHTSWLVLPTSGAKILERCLDN